MVSYENIIETLSLVCLTGFVVIPYMAVMAAFAIIGTQAKQRSAKRIMAAQARGAFADLESPKNTFRFRFLAGFALFGVLGFTCSIGAFALQSLRYYLKPGTELSSLYWVTIGVGLIFGSICAVAVLLINREMNRRL